MTTTTISLDEATLLGLSVHAAAVRRTVGSAVSRHLPPERAKEVLPARLQYLESVGLLTADQSKSLQEFVNSGKRPPKPGPMRSVNGMPGEPENLDTILRGVIWARTGTEVEFGLLGAILDAVVSIADAAIDGFFTGGPIAALQAALGEAVYQLVG
jgi:hypothetical protein